MVFSLSMSHLIWPIRHKADVPGARRGDEEDGGEVERGGDEGDSAEVDGMMQLLLRYTFKEDA